VGGILAWLLRPKSSSGRRENRRERVIIAALDLRFGFGRGARIGPERFVTHDVPARATVVAPAARVLWQKERR